VWAKSPKREGGLDRNRGALSPEIRGRIPPKYAIETTKHQGLAQRAAVIAITTAITESTLHNYTEASDHDSLGLFQQRPSQGWGTPAQITNPVFATNAFLNRMRSKFPNNSWMKGDIGAICQRVQVSKYPDAYAREVHDAQLLVTAMWEGLDDMDENTSITQALDVTIGTIPGGTIKRPFKWWLSAIYSHLIGLENFVHANAKALASIDGVDEQAKAQLETARKDLADNRSTPLSPPRGDA
jgi:hypothetical protein